MRGQRPHIGGQSILEVIIALAVGAILIVGAVAAISSSLKIDVESTAQQTASFLTQELVGNVSAFANSNWRNVYDLARGPTQFYLTVSVGSFATSTGSETIAVDGVNFTRYFTIDSVSRSGPADSIEATYVPANDDPSTQKLTVFTTWSASDGSTATSSLEKYLSRRGNLVFVQTDWSDGGVDNPPETVTLPDTTYKKFATSTDIATTTGAIKIQGF